MSEQELQELISNLKRVLISNENIRCKNPFSEGYQQGQQGAYQCVVDILERQLTKIRSL